MVKQKLFAAFLLLVVAGWGASGWSQDKTASDDPFGGQAPSEPSADPFAPLASPQESGPTEAGAKEESNETEIEEGSAAAESPVFESLGSHAYAERITRALNAPLTNQGLSFTEAPLSEVVNLLRDEYEIEIQLDMQALDDLGLTEDDTVTVNLRNISLAAALKLMLKQHDLTYMIADEVLLITSEDEALARLSVRVYPVGDLLQPREGKGFDTAAKIDDLMEVIIHTVASDTWSENEGGEAEIRPMQPGLLIISQTQAVHEEIGELLAALRRARQHELALPYAPRPLKAKKNSSGGFGDRGTDKSKPVESPKR